MLDPNTPHGRIIKAALDLAATKPWEDVTLAEIAGGAGLSLAELRDHVASKTDILVRLLRAIDDAVLKASKPDPAQSKRDLLFEVVMARFDLLAPYKSSLKSIYASGAADFALAAPFLASQHWMLQAAGIGTDGIAGGARVAGLALAYARVFRVWLKDDDPGLGHTMAALDRDLRHGERVLGGLAQAGSAFGQFSRMAQEMARAASRQARTRAAETASAAPTQPPPPAAEPGPT